MYGYAVIALLALAANAHAQDTSLWVEVSPTTDEVEEIEKRYTPELVKELQSAKDDTLLLYTEFSGRAGMELRHFLREMSGFSNRSAATLGSAVLNSAPESCRQELQKKLFKVESDVKLAASFSGVNHHKFLLGHMVVFRMHLNKSEDYIKKCDRVIASCGISCETTPRVRRWRRHAADEIHRVRDDIQHTRRSYKDLLTHAHRHLNHLRKQANNRAKEIIEHFITCIH
ncbi:unnamed protein product [Diatraea saccharalis]|uniref:Uncharacterized protein n=1 Tax=Diatraea saccharalis TaxID=40085 RepID=A0A9N9R1D3_9NEOP|nr:unnamed protein product [Diatraea saccharalis]